ncbi:MAG TPA: 3-oxoacyl-[acyl-carrier-protein] synthase III C-terminal domain-containing protein [Methanoregulaceae archaeon]|nr:3-oxoacyl-[acyl-carrier-protein] synthase III C-terminal domain-containing protein [Methanoregulaceae archaeon]
METVGIAGIGYYIPDAVITSVEMSERSGIPLHVFTESIGIEQKHIAGEDEHPSVMGTAAAQEAIRKAGIDPSSIGIVAYCGAGFYDYRFWSPAARIQAAVGVKDAYAFEVKNACNGGNLGLHICRQLLAAHPEIECALVVCADILSMAVDYTNTDALSVFIAGDGAAAAVLRKKEPGNRLRSYASRTDGSLSDYVKLPFGGTRLPPADGAANPRNMYICVENREELDRIFSVTYLNNYVRVIREAVEMSGRSVKDIDFLFTNQVKQGLSREILLTLELSEHNTISTLCDYGHMGPVDTLFALELARESGKIRQGDLVVLASSALGFTWAATVLEF